MTIPRMLALNKYNDATLPLHVSAHRLTQMVAKYMGVDLPEDGKKKSAGGTSSLAGTEADPGALDESGSSLFDLFPQVQK